MTWFQLIVILMAVFCVGVVIGMALNSREFK